MSGIIVQYNPKYFSSYPGKDDVKFGYTTNNEGDYIRFIDRHGIAYIVPRSNVNGVYIDTNFVYNIVGIYYIDSSRPDDKIHLSKFLKYQSIHV